MRGIVMVALACLLAGCQPGEKEELPAFVGAWSSPTPAGPATLVLAADNSAATGNSADDTGTWKQEGDVLTIAFKNGRTDRCRWQVNPDGKSLTLTRLGADGQPAGSLTFQKQ